MIETRNQAIERNFRSIMEVIDPTLRARETVERLSPLMWMWKIDRLLQRSSIHRLVDSIADGPLSSSLVAGHPLFLDAPTYPNPLAPAVHRWMRSNHEAATQARDQRDQGTRPIGFRRNDT